MGGDLQGRVALILPCYRCLPELEFTLRDWFRFINPKDVCVVDDGTGLEEITGVNVIRLPQNRGKGYALKMGFKWALSRGYNYVFTVDADGQHRAEHYPKFMTKIEQADMVIGSRLKSVKSMPFLRYLSNRITSAFISVMVGSRVEDSQSGFRLIRREVLELVDLNRNRYDMESELLVKAYWLGLRVEFVDVDVVPSGKSFISPVRDVLNAITLALELIYTKA